MMQQDKEKKPSSRRSLVSDNSQKKGGALVIGVMAAIAMGLVWLARNNGPATTEQPEADIRLPARKPVPRIAALEVPDPVPAPAPLPVVPAPPRHPEEEDDLEIDDARIKSALLAHQVQNMEDQHEQDDDKGPQDENSQFARSVSGIPVKKSTAGKIDSLEYKVLQGKMIEAVLEPRATSDLPGMICATVQKDVYGSSGRLKLIPWGSRVCGVYSAELKKGQDRLFAVWNTLRRPDGVEVALDSAGSDQLGTAGMGGYVDTHFAQIFGISALLSIIGAGSMQSGGNSGYPNTSDYYRQSVQQAASQTANKVLEPYINIMPTIIVPAGTRIRIYVNRDLDFTSAYDEGGAAASPAHSGVTFVQ